MQQHVLQLLLEMQHLVIQVISFHQMLVLLVELELLNVLLLLLLLIVMLVKAIF